MNVLVSDGDADVRLAVRTMLESLRHQVNESCDAATTLETARRSSFELVLLEMQAAEAGGYELLTKLLAASPGLHVAIHASQATVKAAIKAVRYGAFDFVRRPVSRHELAALLQRSARSRLPPVEPADFESSILPFAAEVCLQSKSRAFREAVARAACAARSDAVVLLRGERGTGKSVLARAIHARSGRAAGPFVGVLATERSALAYESELFGFVQGSFASAARDSSGRIACAERGTLYFHEIGEMPLPLQPKLLRLLQDKCYERLGEQSLQTADVRLIAGTRYDLEAAVVAGHFREELHRALNIVEIVLPSLRQRQCDILPLAEHLLRYFARLNHKALSGFTHAAQQVLLAYSWPGNIGELRQAVERGVLLASGAYVDTGQLPVAVVRNDAPLKQSLEIVPLREMEAESIRRALAWTASIEEAAARLGINASTLYRKRKRYGI